MTNLKRNSTKRLVLNIEQDLIDRLDNTIIKHDLKCRKILMEKILSDEIENLIFNLNQKLRG
jgi:metal-responsive CopG/Arc/MetJ family transcriptional regulator